LAQAVLQVFPDAKLGIGPAIDDGFYYDFELSRPLTDGDLQDLEHRMQAILKESQVFTMFPLSREEAADFVNKKGQSYKAEIIRDLDGEEFTFYENGQFVDLCRGPHVSHTSDIGAIKLMKVAGAYWRGSEKNKMLQRIYGTAFHTQAELDAYLLQIEEAKKRDHRVLGKALDLFSIQEDVGPGLVLWHPKGAMIRHLIESYWKDAHLRQGYELINTPHMGQAKLWERSGHLGFYNENMFSAIEVEEQPYFVKPMNCPFHILIYQNRPKSYRDLPIRYAELGTVYRYERSGVLHGLMRVRGFTQDDAHIMCTPEQVRGEIERVLNFCISILRRFGFDDFKIYLSTRPTEKYVGEVSLWEDAEASLKESVEAMGLAYEVDEGGGAFYGPKIDIKIKDAIGREWQCSTIQFDFNLPQRFEMEYVGSDGKKHQPVMIHRALFGSIERFFGILIEHYEGKFPLWLAPVQVKILSLNADAAAFGETLKAQFQDAGFRVGTDFSQEKIGHKIREGAEEKVPYLVILGKREIEAGLVSVRKLGGGDLGTMSVSDLVALLQTEMQG